MSKDVDIEPRILIADGPWQILETIGYLSSGYDTVTHKCEWKKNWLMKTYILIAYYMKQDNPLCPHCEEPVPSMIQTLWTLKNMDKIQADASYGNNIYGPSPFYATFYTARPGQVIPYIPKKVKI